MRKAQTEVSHKRPDSEIADATTSTKRTSSKRSQSRERDSEIAGSKPKAKKHAEKKLKQGSVIKDQAQKHTRRLGSG